MGDRERLQIEVAKLHDAHGRPIKAAVIAHWVQRLTRFTETPNAKVWRVLDQACDGARFPALADIIEASQSRWGDKPPDVGHTSGAARTRADRAMVLSMIWMHLTSGKPLHWFDGHAFARIMGRDEKDPGEFLRAAIEAEKWTKESITAWMDMQIANGN